MRGAPEVWGKSPLHLQEQAQFAIVFGPCQNINRLDAWLKVDIAGIFFFKYPNHFTTSEGVSMLIHIYQHLAYHPSNDRREQT